MNYAATVVAVSSLIYLIVGANAQCRSGTTANCIATYAPEARDYGRKAQQACNNSNSIGNCITMAGCDSRSAEQLGWNGLKNGYLYLCGDGKQKYSQNSACITSFSASSAVGTCATQYQQSLSPAPSTAAALCTIPNTYLSCIDGALSPCGSDAKTVMHAYFYQTLQPIAASFGCSLNANPTSGAISMYLISTTAWVMILVTSLLSTGLI